MEVGSPGSAAEIPWTPCPTTSPRSTAGFHMIPISISEVFAGVPPRSNWLDLTFGKFDPKKKWVVTDMQWDDDVTVEGRDGGTSASVPLKARSLPVHPGGVEEREAIPTSLGGQVLWGNSARTVFGTFTVGMPATTNWIRPQLVADLHPEMASSTVTRVTNLLDDNDDSSSATSRSATPSRRGAGRKERTVADQASRSSATTTPAPADLGKDYDTGYFMRLQVGDYKKKGQMMFRASRYYSEPDALFYVFRPVGHDHGLGCRWLPLRPSPRL